MHTEVGFFQDEHTWVAIAFVIFFAIFGRKLWGALAGILDKRAADVRAELAEAQRLREEAETMLRDAKARRDSAVADAKALLDGARGEAQRLAAAAAADAETSALRREHMALDRIAAAEKAAIDDVRLAAADIAATAAEQVIRDSLTADADAVLIDRAIAGLPTALAPKRAA
jgi:F-type H+-transporting ATPase subunit b